MDALGAGFWAGAGFWDRASAASAKQTAAQRRATRRRPAGPEESFERGSSRGVDIGASSADSIGAATALRTL
jgi:hypothetical protein